MYHYHKCLECNCEWRHFRDTTVSVEKYQENHTCTGCGRDIRQIHRYQHEHNERRYRVWQWGYDIALLCLEVQDREIGEDSAVEILKRIGLELAFAMKITNEEALGMVLRRLKYVNSYTQAI